MPLIAQRTAPVGSVVRLGNPRSVVNRDRHQRNLRYVVTEYGPNGTSVDDQGRRYTKINCTTKRPL